MLRAEFNLSSVLQELKSYYGQGEIPKPSVISADLRHNERYMRIYIDHRFVIYCNQSRAERRSKKTSRNHTATMGSTNSMGDQLMPFCSSHRVVCIRIRERSLPFCLIRIFVNFHLLSINYFVKDENPDENAGRVPCCFSFPPHLRYVQLC